MPCINNRKALRHCINSLMMTDIPCNHHLCTCIDNIAYKAAARAGHHCCQLNNILQTAIHPDIWHIKPEFDKRCKFRHSHTFAKAPYPAKALIKTSLRIEILLIEILFIRNTEHLSVLQFQIIRRCLRHTHHIKIRVHGIITDIISEQFNKPSPNKILRRDSAHLLKNKRMMRQQQVCTKAHCLFDHLICRI